jgi:hypothetical protein
LDPKLLFLPSMVQKIKECSAYTQDSALLQLKSHDKSAVVLCELFLYNNFILSTTRFHNLSKRVGNMLDMQGWATKLVLALITTQFDHTV